MPPRRNPNASPFYGTTFNLYRLSPLSNLPDDLSDDALKPYGRALRDLIRGNVVRGVQIREVNMEEQREKGYLTRCEWNYIEVPKLRPKFDADDDDDDDSDDEDLPAAIQITLTYDPPATFQSIIVPHLEDPDANSNGNYPLLLVRMPKAARDAFTEYLERTFDCHASQMHIPSQSIKDFVETYFNTRVEYAQQIGKDREVLASADVQINFAGGAAAPHMRTFNTTFSNEDVPDIWAKGVKIVEEQEAKKKGKKRKAPGDEPAPRFFFEALKAYFWHVMALRMEKLEVTKAACSGFLISAQRAKMFEGGEILLRLLVTEASQRFDRERN